MTQQLIHLFILTILSLVVCVFLHRDGWPSKINNGLRFALGFISYPLVTGAIDLLVETTAKPGWLETPTPTKVYVFLWVGVFSLVYFIAASIILQTNVHLGLGRLALRILTPLVNSATKALTWLLGRLERHTESP